MCCTFTLIDHTNYRNPLININIFRKDVNLQQWEWSGRIPARNSKIVAIFIRTLLRRGIINAAFVCIVYSVEFLYNLQFHLLTCRLTLGRYFCLKYCFWGIQVFCVNHCQYSMSLVYMQKPKQMGIIYLSVMKYFIPGCELFLGWFSRMKTATARLFICFSLRFIRHVLLLLLFRL